MILVIDIGNTNIHTGLYNNRLISYHKWRTEKGINRKFFKNLFQKKTIEDVVIVSVVPKYSALFSSYFKKEFHKDPFFISSKIRMPIKILYKNLGADRIANMVGGLIRYKENIIVFSFGTAITGDVVSNQGEHLGGIILPGIETQAFGLFSKTAQLKNIKLKKPSKVLGTTTEESIQSGIINGIRYAILGFINAIKGETKRKYRIIATGGWGKKMAGLIPLIEEYNKDLTLYGALQLYYYNEKR